MESRFDKVSNFLQGALPDTPEAVWHDQISDETFALQKLQVIADMEHQLDEAVELGWMTRHERDEIEHEWRRRWLDVPGN